MKPAAVDARPYTAPRTRRRSTGASVLAGVSVFALVLAACGGDDDDADAEGSTTTIGSTVSIAPTTTIASTTTVPATTTTLPPLDLVTEGASIVVANASGIDGAAGRMTDALGAVGFSTGEATNSSEGQIQTSKIYYDPANTEAKAVADSLREALGAGDIEVLELAVPAPTSSGEIGDASILLAMGNDTADKSLDELQGRVAPAEDTSEEDTSEEDTSEGTGDEDTGDEGTGDEGTGDADS